MTVHQGSISFNSLIDIRIARPSDIDNILKLAYQIDELKCIDQDYGIFNKSDLRFCILNTQGVFLVVTKEKEIIGFCYGFVETPNMACLMYIALAKEYRDKGIGESLFNSFHATILDFDVDYIYVLASNPQAETFFHEMGFDAGNSLKYMERHV